MEAEPRERERERASPDLMGLLLEVHAAMWSHGSSSSCMAYPILGELELIQDQARRQLMVELSGCSITSGCTDSRRLETHEETHEN